MAVSLAQLFPFAVCAVCAAAGCGKLSTPYCFRWRLVLKRAFRSVCCLKRFAATQDNVPLFAGACLTRACLSRGGNKTMCTCSVAPPVTAGVGSRASGNTGEQGEGGRVDVVPERAPLCGCHGAPCPGH
ncbi:hypothetical protein ACOMHN_058711 [Nucella lapillus]